MSDSEFKIEMICDKYTEEIRKNSHGPKISTSDLVVYPSGCVLPTPFKDAVDRIYNFKVYPDDTWIVTYPKCGTTWTQEMVWLLRNNLDFKKAKSMDITDRVPFLEFEKLSVVIEPSSDPSPSTILQTENLPRPRCIKSHLPQQMLPKELWTVKPKIIYVARDPKDVVISYFHHFRLWNGYRGNFENFADAFFNDRVLYGSYWSHVLGFLDLKDKSHILFNTFEEMKKDLPSVIKKTAKFMEVEITDQEVQKLKEHLSFKNMKDNSAVNYSSLCDTMKNAVKCDKDVIDLSFIRKGEIGQWKKEFGKAILEKFERWNNEHLKDRNFKEYPPW